MEELKRKRGRPPKGAEPPEPAKRPRGRPPKEKPVDETPKIRRRKWTQEDINYLRFKWGRVSVPAIARGLGRTEKAVQVKASVLGLGWEIESSGYIYINQLREYAGKTKSIKSWIAHGLPVREKFIGRKKATVVSIPDFWNWAEQHRHMINFVGIEPLVFGEEPEWVAAQRKADALRTAQKRESRRWTDYDMSSLMHMAGSGRYTLSEMATELRRTEQAVAHRMSVMGITNARGKKDPYHWTKADNEAAKQIIIDGGDYCAIAKAVGTSESSAMSHMYQLYGYTDLEKLRPMLTPKTGQRYRIEEVEDD